MDNTHVARSIARDLGRELASAAHMKSLVRTKVGEFVLADCLDAADIGNSEAILRSLRPV